MHALGGSSSHFVSTLTCLNPTLPSSQSSLYIFFSSAFQIISTAHKSMYILTRTQHRVWLLRLKACLLGSFLDRVFPVHPEWPRTAAVRQAAHTHVTSWALLNQAQLRSPSTGWLKEAIGVKGGRGTGATAADDMGRRLPGHTACSCPLSFPCLTPDVQHTMTYYTELWPDLSNLTQVPIGSSRCMTTGCSVISVSVLSPPGSSSTSDVVLQK